MDKEPVLLAIDTAQELGSVCIARGKHLLAFRSQEQQKDHAIWIHQAIEDMRIEANLSWSDIDGVTVSNGPGSYTGLRVGLSTSKGISFSLNRPLITIGTLEMMAWGMKEMTSEWICPMIDARRMEVYYAIYRNDLSVVEGPSAKILQQKSFDEYLHDHQIVFAGSGSKKFQESSFSHKNATFVNLVFDCRLLLLPSLKKFREKEFADLAYAEPLYVKEFFSTMKKPLI